MPIVGEVPKWPALSPDTAIVNRHWLLARRLKDLQQRQDSFWIPTAINHERVNTQLTASSIPSQSHSRPKSSTYSAQNGHSVTTPVRHPARPADKHHEPPGKLLLQILHVPCLDVAAVELRCCWCELPSFLCFSGRLAQSFGHMSSLEAGAGNRTCTRAWEMMVNRPRFWNGISMAYKFTLEIVSVAWQLYALTLHMCWPNRLPGGST